MCLRFLWVDDPSSDSPKVIVKRFNRVAFGVTSSPFLLNGTEQHHIAKYATKDPQFARDMLNSLYVTLTILMEGRVMFLKQWISTE